MSISSINVKKFYNEIVETEKVFTIKDAGGYPAPKNSEGERSQPFWSSRASAQKVIETVSVYADFEVVEISLDEFEKKWLKGLIEDGFLVGVNWSGRRATGHDLPPGLIMRQIALKKSD